MFHSMKSKKGHQEMLSPKAFAALHNVGYTTVLFWLKNDLIEGVEKETLPFGKDRFIYRIPADAPRPEIKPGPKPKVSADEPDQTEQDEATNEPDKPKRRKGKKAK